MKWRLPILLATVACAETPHDPAELMEADRAFNRATEQRGSAAWAEWFAADGTLIVAQMGELRGIEQILAVASYLDQPGVIQTWTPERAEISESGDMGWTTGSYVSGVEGQPAREEGRYVTIWRRNQNGDWKVVMDLWNPVTTSP